MPKKKRKKFKKQFKAQIIQQYTQTKQETTSVETVSQKESPAPTAQPVQPVVDDELIFGTNVAIVKHDLKKIAILVGAMLVLLLILVTLDLKTPWFSALSTAVARLLHFQ